MKRIYLSLCAAMFLATLSTVCKASPPHATGVGPPIPTIAPAFEAPTIIDVALQQIDITLEACRDVGATHIVSMTDQHQVTAVADLPITDYNLACPERAVNVVSITRYLRSPLQRSKDVIRPPSILHLE